MAPGAREGKKPSPLPDHGPCGGREKNLPCPVVQRLPKGERKALHRRLAAFYLVYRKIIYNYIFYNI
ncbi:hypothetical protein D7V94_18355 [Parablautia intestinalis]|uniref:Uncharacterized protein n=1 Tax=Parablautia intestinalis TaxID=2320100 RepID=A0A3A9AQ77_9FIRM|nr:hypothetical protein D7V94_18355 [Parablautia intestinalis]